MLISKIYRFKEIQIVHIWVIKYCNVINSWSKAVLIIKSKIAKTNDKYILFGLAVNEESVLRNSI